MSLLVMVALPAAAGSASAADAPKIHDGVSAPAAAWGAAMEAGDVRALARMYAPDAVSYPPDKMAVKGAAAIKADYESLFAKYTVTVKNDEAHWIEQPPLVVSWGITTLTLHPKAGGADVTSRSRFTDAAIKTADGWRYVVDHASAPTGK